MKCFYTAAHENSMILFDLDRTLFMQVWSSNLLNVIHCLKIDKLNLEQQGSIWWNNIASTCITKTSEPKQQRNQLKPVDRSTSA